MVVSLKGKIGSLKCKLEEDTGNGFNDSNDE